MIERQKNKYGWEFLFIGANIDAVETAARYGISPERAVNYHADKKGTKIVYESVSQAMCSMRACGGIDDEWNEKINADFTARKPDRRR